MHTVENHLGFICLTVRQNDADILVVKANKIVSLSYGDEKGCIVSTTEDSYLVKETISEIIGQIQNVNPDMR